MASDWRFLISRIPAVANRKIGVEACFATGSGRGGGVGKVENFDGGIF